MRRLVLFGVRNVRVYGIIDCMNTTIEQMGDDLVVCIPQEIAAKLGLHVGSIVTVVEEADYIRIVPVK